MSTPFGLPRHMGEAPETIDDHEHDWGSVELARFTGNPHRKCQWSDPETGETCRFVSLDLDDGEDAEA